MPRQEVAEVKITNMSRRVVAEIQRLLRNRKFEVSDEGLHLSNGVFAGGRFGSSVNGGPIERAHNIVVTEGLVYLAQAALDGGAQVSNFYLAPFSGNITPAASLTAATFNAAATEFTNYTETSRRQWNKVRTGAAFSNSASIALITVNAAAQTVRGCALMTEATKGSGSGTLISAGRFPNDRTGLGVNDQVGLLYDFAFQDDAV